MVGPFKIGSMVGIFQRFGSRRREQVLVQRFLSFRQQNMPNFHAAIIYHSYSTVSKSRNKYKYNLKKKKRKEKGGGGGEEGEYNYSVI